MGRREQVIVPKSGKNPLQDGAVTAGYLKKKKM